MSMMTFSGERGRSAGLPRAGAPNDDRAGAMSSRCALGPSAMETENLADLYDLAPPDWAPVRARLEQPITMAPGTGGPDRHTCWLATIDADGSPHVTGLGMEWLDGSFFFETGARTRKA